MSSWHSPFLTCVVSADVCVNFSKYVKTKFRESRHLETHVSWSPGWSWVHFLRRSVVHFLWWKNIRICDHSLEINVKFNWNCNITIENEIDRWKSRCHHIKIFITTLIAHILCSWISFDEKICFCKNIVWRRTFSTSYVFFSGTPLFFREVVIVGKQLGLCQAFFHSQIYELNIMVIHIMKSILQDSILTQEIWSIFSQTTTWIGRMQLWYPNLCIFYSWYKTFFILRYATVNQVILLLEFHVTSIEALGIFRDQDGRLYCISFYHASKKSRNI